MPAVRLQAQRDRRPLTGVMFGTSLDESKALTTKLTKSRSRLFLTGKDWDEQTHYHSRRLRFGEHKRCFLRFFELQCTM